jgi:RNA polymerase sigma-70 factor (ECF subfamily)
VSVTATIGEAFETVNWGTPDSETQAGATAGGGPLGLLGAEFPRLYGKVHRYLLHRLFDPELAEELTAEVFYKAAASPGRVPGEPDRLLFWLLRIATNLGNSHQRRGRLRRLLLGRFAAQANVEATIGPSRESVDGDDVSRLRSALLALRPKYQTVVVLRFYSRMSSREIAAVVGCNEAAVRARLSRAVKELRERLGLPTPDGQQRTLRARSR